MPKWLWTLYHIAGRTASGSDQEYSKKILKNSVKGYIFHYEYEGGKCNNFQKEYPHPKYAKSNIYEENEFTHWIGKVMGFKVALLNTIDGKEIEFWAWFDPFARIENGKRKTESC